MTDGMWMTALLFLSLLNTAAGRQFLAVQTSYAWILWSKGQTITNISAVNIVEDYFKPLSLQGLHTWGLITEIHQLVDI